MPRSLVAPRIAEGMGRPTGRQEKSPGGLAGGSRDIIVGSNIFNILWVLGLAAIVAPQRIPVSPMGMTFDLPVMIATSVAALPIFFTGCRIARWEDFSPLGY